MKKTLILSLCLLFCLSVTAAAAALSIPSAPDVVRPRKSYELVLETAAEGTVSMTLEDAGGQTYTVLRDYPLQIGENVLRWDGLLPDFSPVAEGDYTLRLQMGDGQSLSAPLRVGAPYPLLSETGHVSGLDAVEVTLYASEAGTLFVRVETADGATLLEDSLPVQAGETVYAWGYAQDGQRVPAGQYLLVFQLRTANGFSSNEQYSYVEVSAPADESVDAQAAAQAIVDITPSPTPVATPTPEPTPALSAPYSQVDDGTFWAMLPGETDDAVIWDVLTQPIIVYDDGKLNGKEHAYLMENPDGTGEQVAQLHALSQGVHIIGEVNEYGYVLVEAFSNYDRDYSPETDEERAHAFDVKQGYVLAENLKTVEVHQDMALLIDKLTQRMYLFIDGERVTEFIISTGLVTNEEDTLFETIPGEYITVSHTGTLVDGNMNSAMAIRINGGILLHEVPHKINADGTKNYASFEGYLGQKKSHGCIRNERRKTPEGYNQAWIWENFERGEPYKVIIWDDLNRVDTPTVWRENPYH